MAGTERKVAGEAGGSRSVPGIMSSDGDEYGMAAGAWADGVLGGDACTRADAGDCTRDEVSERTLCWAAADEGSLSGECALCADGVAAREDVCGDDGTLPPRGGRHAESLGSKARGTAA